MNLLSIQLANLLDENLQVSANLPKEIRARVFLSPDKRTQSGEPAEVPEMRTPTRHNAIYVFALP